MYSSRKLTMALFLIILFLSGCEVSSPNSYVIEMHPKNINEMKLKEKEKYNNDRKKCKVLFEENYEGNLSRVEKNEMEDDFLFDCLFEKGWSITDSYLVPEKIQ